MKNCYKLIGLFVMMQLAINSNAQDAAALHATAKNFIRQGDYTNAVLVLNRALDQKPGDLELLKEISFTYYLQHNYAKAIEVAKPLSERKDADVQTYQITAMIYKALEEKKDCERLYKTALKKFPASGVLHNEYGEMLWSKKDFGDAISHWEKGIQTDPNYPGNYYNAAKYYYFTVDKVWGLLYGEIFVNMESYSDRTVEIKKLLMEGYKKLFSDKDIANKQNMRNPFVKAYIETIQQQSGAVNTGVTLDNIMQLRTKFIADWQPKYAKLFPFRLFEHHNQLVNLGTFEAYNQWLFTAVLYPSAYQQWITSHEKENGEFLKLQQNRVFKVPAGQYYQTQSK